MEKHSYERILKSSLLIGCATGLNVAIGLVRIKAMAILLGPAGFGLMALYASIVDFTRSIAGMGINSSGVRQIAEAAGSQDATRIARTIMALRRTSVLLGMFGATLLVVFSEQISTLTFGSKQHSSAIALLSLAVFFSLLAESRGALIQGMRRISDLALMGVLSSILGMVVSIVAVYILREEGVVPALIAVAAISFAVSCWYGRRTGIRPAVITASEMKKEASSLLKLGFAFMASGILMMGAAYAVRIMVLRDVGLDAAGLYQAAWTLGGLYVGFILQAMGTDFYPRLVGVANDNHECSRLVNEQTHVSVLLAAPGVIATLTLAPIVIPLLYTDKFIEATEVLRWICLGIALRVITWPIGFIIVVKNRQAVFLLAEFAWASVNVGITWICVPFFGLEGAGIAFFASYVFHGFMIYALVRRLSDFRWSAANKKTGLLFLSTIGVVFIGFHNLPPPLATGLGVLAMIVASLYSLRALLNLLPTNPIPKKLDHLRNLLLQRPIR